MADDKPTNLKLVDPEQEMKDNAAANERYLEEFEAWLEASGLSEKTVDKHYRNADFFLNWYLVDEEPTPMEDGMDTVDHFIGTYLARDEYKSLSTIKENLTSLKKFYQCMADKGHVTRERYAQFLEEIRQNKDIWFEESQSYLDDLPPELSSKALSSMLREPLFSDMAMSFADLLMEAMGMPSDDDYDDLFGGYGPEDEYDEETDEDEETLCRLRAEVLDQLIVTAFYVMANKEPGKSGKPVYLCRKNIIDEITLSGMDFEGYVGHDSPTDELAHITDLGVSVAKSVLRDLGYPELAKDDE